MDDSIHISGKAHNTLGKRMGMAMLNLIEQESDCKPPISVRSIEMIEEENDRSQVKLEEGFSYDRSRLYTSKP